mmetsp:Transcript_18257/g.50688  ORF Transcript_18257/g.50688 Transcript_18257/m.50688 type:complete len:306 (-) Transcript_18257:250-1167(-)
MSRKPTIVMRLRESLGRAFRETGQFLDRVGIQGEMLATTKREIGDDPIIFQDHLSRHRQKMPLLWRGKPIVSPDAAFIAPCATMIGSVCIEPGASIFYKAILRADNCENARSFILPDEEAKKVWELDDKRLDKGRTTSIGGGIFVGENSNIQDGCLISATVNHTQIGNGVTVGHLARIDSATIGDNCLIGMGSVLLPGVQIGDESFIAAGAVVSKDTEISSGELWVGNPARKLRDLTPKERQRLHYQSSEYVKVASSHADVMKLDGGLPESLREYATPPSTESTPGEPASVSSSEEDNAEHEKKP